MRAAQPAPPEHSPANESGPACQAALRWPGGFRETFRGSGSLAGDAAVAGADKGDQMQGLRRGNFAFDARQRFFQLQAGTVEIAVGLLEDADLGRLVSGDRKSVAWLKTGEA